MARHWQCHVTEVVMCDVMSSCRPSNCGFGYGFNKMKTGGFGFTHLFLVLVLVLILPITVPNRTVAISSWGCEVQNNGIFIKSLRTMVDQWRVSKRTGVWSNSPLPVPHSLFSHKRCIQTPKINYREKKNLKNRPNYSTQIFFLFQQIITQLLSTVVLVFLPSPAQYVIFLVASPPSTGRADWQLHMNHRSVNITSFFWATENW